jgi:hypothetical protein
MKRIVAVLLLFLAPALSVAEEGYPEVCSQVYGAAADAADAAVSRDTKSIAAMKKVVAPRTSIAKLPPELGELLRSLNDIVDEAFGTLPVDRLTYPVHRAEICVRRLRGKPVPDNFKAVQPKLLECSKKPEKLAIPCAMELAGSSQANEDA